MLMASIVAYPNGIGLDRFFFLSELSKIAFIVLLVYQWLMLFLNIPTCFILSKLLLISLPYIHLNSSNKFISYYFSIIELTLKRQQYSYGQMNLKTKTNHHSPLADMSKMLRKVTNNHHAELEQEFEQMKTRFFGSKLGCDRYDQLNAGDFGQSTEPDSDAQANYVKTSHSDHSHHATTVLAASTLKINKTYRKPKRTKVKDIISKLNLLNNRLKSNHLFAKQTKRHLLDKDS